MKNDNVIDFSVYRTSCSASLEKNTQNNSASELILAIQHLIQRLREHGPLKQTG